MSNVQCQLSNVKGIQMNVLMVGDEIVICICVWMFNVDATFKANGACRRERWTQVNPNVLYVCLLLKEVGWSCC